MFFTVWTLLITFITSAQALEVNIPAALQSEQGQVIVKDLPGYPGAAEGHPFQYVQYIPENITLPKLGVIVVVHGSLGYVEKEIIVNGEPRMVPDYDENGILKTLPIHSGVEAAKSMLEHWKQVADEKQYMIIAPAFDSQNFGGGTAPCNTCVTYGGYRGIQGRHYEGVPVRETDSDGVLNQVIDNYQADFPGFFDEQFYLTGHSAGGQFTSRYIFLHPERLRGAVVGSAGFVPFPDASIPWPDGMGNSSALNLNLSWYPGQPTRAFIIDPIAANFEMVAKKRITLLAGEYEVHPEVMHDTANKTRHFHHELRKGLLNDPVEGVQLKIVEGRKHNGSRLAPTTINLMLPSQRSVWEFSGGMDVNSTDNPNYTFSLSDSKRVKIDLESDVDTYLYLLDESMSVIAEDDNSGEGTNAKIKENLVPGTYTIVVATKQVGEAAIFDLFANIPTAVDMTTEPMVDEHHLDVCDGNGHCGVSEVLHEWCQQNQGKSQATHWSIEKSSQEKPYTTKNIFNGSVCTSIGICDFFRDVKCGSFSDLLPENEGYAPYIENYSMNIDGDTVTVTGTAVDADNDLASVHLSVIGLYIYDEEDYNDQFNVSALIDCDGTTNWSCTFSAELATQYYINVYAKDQSGLVGSPTNIVKRTLGGASCNSETSSLDDHVSAGRAYKVQTGGYWIWLTYTWYAEGTDEELGINGTSVVTLVESGNDSWSTDGSCSVSNAPEFTNVISTIAGASVDIEVEVADDDNDILNVSITYDGKTSNCVNDHLSTTKWNCGIGGLSSGSGQAVLTVIDLLGNEATSSISFNIESGSAPEITSYNWIIDGTTVVVTGTAQDADGDLVRVLLTLDSGIMECEGTESFTCILDDLPEGSSYTFYLFAEDAENQQSEQVGPIEFVIPTGVASTIESVNAEVIGTTVRIYGAAADVDGDLDRVYVVNGMGSQLCFGTYTYECVIEGISAGDYTLHVLATDIYDQSSELVPVSFTIVAQSAPVIGAWDMVVNGSTVTVTGTASDDDGDLSGVEGQIHVSGFACTGTASFTCIIENASTGNHAVKLRAVDAAGNYSDWTEERNAAVLGVAPIINSASVAVDGQKVTITVTGTDSDGDIVGAILEMIDGRLPCGGEGAMVCVREGLAVGNYTAKVQLTDAQMNLSEFYDVEFTIDPIVSSCVTAANSTHASEGRATVSYGILVYAVGSNDYLGITSATTSLEETAPNNWVMQTSCP